MGKRVMGGIQRQGSSCHRRVFMLVSAPHLSFPSLHATGILRYARVLGEAGNKLESEEVY